MFRSNYKRVTKIIFFSNQLPLFRAISRINRPIKQSVNIGFFFQKVNICANKIIMIT